LLCFLLKDFQILFVVKLTKMECIDFVCFHLAQARFSSLVRNDWIDQIIRYAMLFKKLEHRLMIVPGGFKNNSRWLSGNLFHFLIKPIESMKPLSIVFKFKALLVGLFPF